MSSFLFLFLSSFFYNRKILFFFFPWELDLLSSLTYRVAALREIGGALRFGWRGEVLGVAAAVGGSDGGLEIALDVGCL